MLFNHFTSWAITEDLLNQEMLTAWEYSQYWESKTKQREFPAISQNTQLLQLVLNSVSSDVGKNLMNSKYYAMMLKQYIFEDIE